MKPIRPSPQYWDLRFSGAGHLISYHLGVAQTLYKHTPKSVTITSVAGSSSGAIVSAVLSCFPHRLAEYTNRFLNDDGRAYAHFAKMLENRRTHVDGTGTHQPRLHIATTRCSDGSLKVFTFEPNILNLQKDELLLALQASCRIPVSFHPWDIFSKQPPSYPDQDGIEIDGKFYVDGGISAPCPPVHLDDQRSASIVISPISGSSAAKWSIRPMDTSWKLPLIGDLNARCGTFGVRPSVDNLRALVVSAGAASPPV